MLSKAMNKLTKAPLSQQCSARRSCRAASQQLLGYGTADVDGYSCLSKELRNKAYDDRMGDANTFLRQQSRKKAMTWP
jgi:hypothetical protein